jgi:trigger factor
MQFHVETVGPCRAKVKVTVPETRIREEFDRQYQEINKSVALPGFRPGHAPRKLLEARFGKRLSDDVKAKLVEAAFEELVQKKEVRPLAPPQIDAGAIAFDPTRPMEFEFEVLTRPEFETPSRDALQVKVPPIEVSPAEVDAALERMRIAEGTLVSAEDGVVGKDSVLVVDWKARAEGDEVASGENAYYRIGRGLLEGLVAPGLDEAVAGKRAGETVTVPARAAGDDARERLRGKAVDLEATVREVKRFKPAELDEAFLKSHDFDSVDELKGDVRRRIVRARERDRDRLAEDRLVDQLVERAKIPLPDAVVEGEVERWLERRRVEAQAEGLDPAEVTKEAAADRDEIRERVERDLRRHFLLERLSEADKTEVGDSEVLGAIEQMARDSGRPSSELVEAFRSSGRIDELRGHLRHRKVKEALRRSASVVEETGASRGTAAGKAEPEEEKPKSKKKKG